MPIVPQVGEALADAHRLDIRLRLLRGNRELGRVVVVANGAHQLFGKSPHFDQSRGYFGVIDVKILLLDRMEAHRTHVYQKWCDVGWSHQRVTATAAAITILLSLLGAASMAGDPALRAAADLAAVGVVLAYLRSPALLARRAARAEAR